jgi:succinyl-CoA synthetase beta subunit
MNIHEYQAKTILSGYGIVVPEGVVIHSKAEAERAVKDFAHQGIFVVKAQIHAGGRGKAGGVKVVKTQEDAIREAKAMFGMTLVTHQTGPEGQEVHRVYVEEGCDIDVEYYLSLVVDRATAMVTFMVSSEGGVEIEEIAEKSPEKIMMVGIDPAMSMQPFHARKMGFFLGFEGDVLKKFIKLATKLYSCFVELDASQLEINPLVKTKTGDLIALDAKINFDDNALYRHKEIAEMRDEQEEDPLEMRASKSDLNYVKMDGNIGCMVNGAGLAMATMDIIKLHGGEPANFLDVGGGATKERVTEAFKIILSDENVKGLLVNIFGGIMRCDIIAEGIVAAARDIDLKVPVVVRLAGTNFELGKEILSRSGLKILAAEDLGDAAEKVVNSIGGV